MSCTLTVVDKNKKESHNKCYSLVINNFTKKETIICDANFDVLNNVYHIFLRCDKLEYIDIFKLWKNNIHMSFYLPTTESILLPQLKHGIYIKK